MPAACPLFRRRALRWLALGLAVRLVGFAAEERPAILVPKAEVAEVRATPAVPPPARAPISERLRAEMTGRLREQAAALPEIETRPTGSVEGTAAGGAAKSDTGAVVMPRYVVKSTGPSQREVEPGNMLLRPLREFERIEAIERNAESYAASLLRFRNGTELELRISNRTGRGADHGRETTRLEIGFRVPR